MQFYNWSWYEIKVIFKWAEINKTNSWVLHSGDYAYYLSPARLTLVSADVARAALEFENVYWAGLSTEGLKQIHSYYFIFSKTKYLICLFRLVHTTTCIYFGERQKQSSFYKASTLGRTLKHSYCFGNYHQYSSSTNAKRTSVLFLEVHTSYITNLFIIPFIIMFDLSFISNSIWYKFHLWY